ncbi:glucuronate isomerase [Psychromonas sp. CNPT3]|uniref:glucuronate isomerase n=1 Tax=Psychromonas sp. CNPT3 TaxID=314282 RepID=UPI00006EA480|nr:glucuronate isomerase [Psychromonas sp. CNPT3]AGH81320.1 glucuronate isomerase [Psychromonas sp. CNPT3]
MKNFLDDDFLLQNKVAIDLYHHFAKDMPIYDYHCHLDASQIADDKNFDNLTQIWLAGDHYKWRGMRAAGVPEALITGTTSSDHEKFLAWAQTVPKTMGNPLYHWTHLELRRPFGITDKQLNTQSANSIWHDCNAMLATPEFSTRAIMKKMNVVMVGTTDDPIDSLAAHQQIASDNSFDIEVCPTFRPDKAFKIELDGFSEYMTLLGAAAHIEIDSFDALLSALKNRLQYFIQQGCKAADHGLEIVRFAVQPSLKELDIILDLGIRKQPLTELQIAQFSTAVQVFLGKQYAKYAMVMQLHIGAQRNNSTKMFKLLGADAGFDSISDANYSAQLSAFLDAMDVTDELPKTIIYCLNPRDNAMIATMIGNFQGGGIAGKIQFGSGWWFNDQKDGMEQQMQQLSQLGLLSCFVGMLTDSRSFLSYTRHEYFRRILCNMIGTWVVEGLAPNDPALLGEMVKDICFNNAQKFFQMLK